jgi:anti-sigma factor RsiW
MIRCADMEPLLADYADGTADERTRRIVERHIQLCDRCRSRLDRAVQVSGQLRRLPLLPAGVSSRMGRFRRRLDVRVEQGPRGLEHYPFYVSMILAALITIATLLTIFYLGL